MESWKTYHVSSQWTVGIAVLHVDDTKQLGEQDDIDQVGTQVPGKIILGLGTIS